MAHIKLYKASIILVAVLALFSWSAFAQGLDGQAVMQRAFDRDDGKDSLFKINMVLIDKSGNQRDRKLDVYSKDCAQGLIKNLVEFTDPADIQGTKFLTLENTEGENSQYLYLPELGRSRRIVSSQKNLRFVNTDFTYEDMQRRSPDKDEHKLLGEEVVTGRSCYLIQSLPKDNSQYSKRISRVDKESSLMLKTEFFDKKGGLIKVFTVNKIEKISGIWTALETLMEDLKEQHKTEMKVLEAKYNIDVKDELFSL